MVKERQLLQQGHNGIRKRTVLPIFLLVSFTPNYNYRYICIVYDDQMMTIV